jgi:Domain of unknown function (DUF4304)
LRPRRSRRRALLLYASEQRVGPWLRERGFRKRRNRFRRDVDGAWQVVDFQASQWGNRDDVRFTINLWVGVPDLATEESAGDPQLEQRIGALTGAGEDHWWSVDADTNVPRLAEELRSVPAGAIRDAA